MRRHPSGRGVGCQWPAGWGLQARPSLPAGVVEGLECPEVPPGGGQAVLQELPAALARGLEELHVASQPGLRRESSESRRRPPPALPALGPGRKVGPHLGRFRSSETPLPQIPACWGRDRLQLQRQGQRVCPLIAFPGACVAATWPPAPSNAIISRHPRVKVGLCG